MGTWSIKAWLVWGGGEAGGNGGNGVGQRPRLFIWPERPFKVWELLPAFVPSAARPAGAACGAAAPVGPCTHSAFSARACVGALSQVALPTFAWLCGFFEAFHNSFPCSLAPLVTFVLWTCFLCCVYTVQWVTCSPVCLPHKTVSFLRTVNFYILSALLDTSTQEMLKNVEFNWLGASYLWRFFLLLKCNLLKVVAFSMIPDNRKWSWDQSSA